MLSWITGIDIGGTHITVCLVNPETGVLKEESMTRHVVNPAANAGDIISGWADAVKACWEKAGFRAEKMGIAMPGPFDYENGVSLIKGLSKYESLYQLPVKAMLAAELHITENNIKMVNDASAYIRGECGMGCARGANDVLGITLGTGLGSALYRNGRLQDGDLYCFPFRGARAEDFVSTRWFLQTYEQVAGTRLAGVKELAVRANEDPQVLALFSEFGETLAEVIQARYAPHVPATIVVGGNIARAWHLFLPALHQKLGGQHELRLASLGEAAALTGAAFLWI